MEGLFKDAYGEVVAWRVALVVAIAVAAAVALAIALFGPKSDDGSGDDEHMELPAPTQAPAADAGVDAWLAALEGSDRLSVLERVEVVGLMHAIESWSKANPHEDARPSVIDVAKDESGAVTARLHVAHAGGETWLEATLPSAGAWQVTERPEGFEPALGDHVAATDGTALAQIMDPAVASEVHGSSRRPASRAQARRGPRRSPSPTQKALRA